MSVPAPEVVRRRVPGAAVALVVLVTAVFFVDVCGLAFDCGCRSLWAGGFTDCNIHHVEGPHCPWCEYPLTAGASAFAAIVAVQFAALYGGLPAGPWARVTLALLALPGVGLLVGRLQAWWLGYPL